MRKHPYAKCEECPLREGGRFVETVGPATADLAVVGESPSKMDTRSGQAFSGPSGRLLNIVLDHHGLDKDEIVFTNATLCRPPDGSAPPKSAILACRQRLVMELEERGVSKVVALGNSACESVLGRTGITQLRVGPPKESPYLPGVEVVPAVNPAACLRQGDQFPDFVSDIGKVKYEHRVWNPPQYIVSDGVDHAVGLLAEIDRRLSSGEELVDNPERILAVDIEVDIDKDSGFDHPNQYGMLCVGLGYDRGKVLVLSERDMGSEEVQDRLGQLFERHRLVFQNGKFDCAGLFPLLGDVNAWFDTMLASYALDERPGIHGLEYMGIEHLGTPDWKHALDKWQPKKNGYGVIPRPVLYQYNAYDLAVTYDLAYLFMERLEKEGLRRVHDNLVKWGNQLKFLELNGIAIDRKYIRELDAQFVQSITVRKDKINELVDKNYDKFGGINPNSPQQLKKFFFDQGITLSSTDADTMDVLLKRKVLPNEETVRPFIELLLEHRSEAKAHGTYVKGMAKRLYRGKVHSTFLLHGTVTGRLSSRNPNLQNITRDVEGKPSIRRLFVPTSDENIFVQTDYSQAELRVLSYLASDKYFRRIFNDGTIDVFDDLTPILYPGADRSKMSKEAWKALRIRVKAYVYGVSYGRSEFSIAREFGISVAEARAGMERFFDVIPEIVSFRERTRQAVLDGEDLITPWGRHRRYTLITDENRDNIMNEALAFLPQSTASDMCLQAMAWSRVELRGHAFIRNIVHDSILLECKKSKVDYVTQVVERNMIESAKTIVGDYVKFAVETTVGDNWGAL